MVEYEKKLLKKKTWKKFQHGMQILQQEKKQNILTMEN